MAKSQHLRKHVTREMISGPTKIQNAQYHTNSNLHDSCNSFFSSPYNDRFLFILITEIRGTILGSQAKALEVRKKKRLLNSCLLITYQTAFFS